MASKELAEFLTEQCRTKGLSLRSLSIKAGLSPSAVHSLIKRKYQPRLHSLNKLADYLGVNREYLWQLAGFIPNESQYKEDPTDSQLLFHFARVGKLPKPAKKLIISIIKSLIGFLEEKAT